MAPSSTSSASVVNSSKDFSLGASSHGSSTRVSSTGDVTPPEITEVLFRDPSVVVGMACRVPGATNTRELWNNLSKKKDLRGKIPANRFNVDAFYHPQGTNKGTVSLNIQAPPSLRSELLGSFETSRKLRCATRKTLYPL